MKKILFVFLVIMLASPSVFAMGAGYRYSNGGAIYSEVNMPLSLPIAQYNQAQDSTLVPISPQARNNQVDIKRLKTYQTSTLNVLCLVEGGNAGIYRTAKKGGINTVHYVETKFERLWIPLGFIPIYFKRNITTVYGE